MARRRGFFGRFSKRKHLQGDDKGGSFLSSWRERRKANKPVGRHFREEPKKGILERFKGWREKRKEERLFSEESVKATPQKQAAPPEREKNIYKTPVDKKEQGGNAPINQKEFLPGVSDLAGEASKLSGIENIKDEEIPRSLSPAQLKALFSATSDIWADNPDGREEEILFAFKVDTLEEAYAKYIRPTEKTLEEFDLYSATVGEAYDFVQAYFR